MFMNKNTYRDVYYTGACLDYINCTSLRLILRHSLFVPRLEKNQARKSAYLVV